MGSSASTIAKVQRSFRAVAQPRQISLRVAARVYAPCSVSRIRNRQQCRKAAQTAGCIAIFITSQIHKMGMKGWPGPSRVGVVILVLRPTSQCALLRYATLVPEEEVLARGISSLASDIRPGHPPVRRKGAKRQGSSRRAARRVRAGFPAQHEITARPSIGARSIGHAG